MILKKNNHQKRSQLPLQYRQSPLGVTSIIEDPLLQSFVVVFDEGYDVETISFYWCNK